MNPKLPKNLQAVLWSKNIDKLDFQKSKNYVIHQILAYGTWEHLVWLFKKYPEGAIRKVFSTQPEKDYSEKSFNFAKNILLEINSDLDKTKYVKTFPRSIR